MGGNLKVWVLKFRGKIFGGNIMVYISSGETNTVYPPTLQALSLVLVHLRLEFRKLGTALEHNYVVMLLFCFSVKINSYNKIFFVEGFESNH